VLAALPAGTVTLGAGFEAQRCTALPVGPGDRPVQGMVTELGIRWLGMVIKI
jgi:hypothetical protein